MKGEVGVLNTLQNFKLSFKIKNKISFIKLCLNRVLKFVIRIKMCCEEMIKFQIKIIMKSKIL